MTFPAEGGEALRNSLRGEGLRISCGRLRICRGRFRIYRAAEVDRGGLQQRVRTANFNW